MNSFAGLSVLKLCSDLPRAVLGYYRKHRRIPNLVRPKTFNEHIVHKRLFDRNPLLTQLADKYAVRDYVAARIGPAYLKQLYQVTADPATLEWDALPNSFVVKATHGCGFNLLVPDKKQLDVTTAIAQCHTWLGENYYWRGREWCYKDIPPRIIVEEFLSADDQHTIPHNYEFFCFGGVPTYIQIYVDYLDVHRSNFYDTAWNKVPVKLNLPTYDQEIAPPPNLAEMLHIAGKLAAGLDFIRVDLYNVKHRVVFGEMTNYPANGKITFKPVEYDTIVGRNWISS